MFPGGAAPLRPPLKERRGTCPQDDMSLKPLRILFLIAAWSGCMTAAAADRATAASDTWVRETLLETGYPGARLLIARGDTVLVDIAAGHADIARSRALRGDAIYRIHSMTKPIVSAAALRLV